MSDATRLRYPDTRRDGTRDTYFGIDVEDPYRWLEAEASEEVVEWVGHQRQLTSAYLMGLPSREFFKSRLEQLWSPARTEVPCRVAGRLFFRRTEAEHPGGAVFEQREPGERARVVIDAAELSSDGTVALTWDVTFSTDGRYMAYGVSRGGSDLSTLKVREIATRADLSDEVHWVQFSLTAWTHDGAGFFYSRFPTRDESVALTAGLSGHQLCYHRLGTPQSEDVVVLQATDRPHQMYMAAMNHDGRYLFVVVLDSTGKKLYYFDLGDPLHPNVTAPVVRLIDEPGANHQPIGVVDGTLYMLTNRDARNHRIVAVDLSAPERPNWRTVVAEQGTPIDGAMMPFIGSAALLVGDRLVVRYLDAGASRFSVFRLDGTPEGDLEVPGTGSVPLISWPVLSGHFSEPELFFPLSSFLAPPSVWRADVSTRKCELFASSPTPFDASGFETVQEFCTSKDGTAVPMFITRRRDLDRNGGNPTVITGYGGFGLNVGPSWDPAFSAWLDAGGVLAVVSLRGGGEYGEAWHQGGMLDRKQNVFDDFYAAAEHLRCEGYTDGSHLACYGLSNGGLLVGAAITQRPELFAAAVPHIGLFDMLRYHRFTAAQLWLGEYGCAETDEAQFRTLLAYSPLHNVRPGTCFPPTLVMTSDRDDRVPPNHSYKFVAALQAAQGCDNPVLIRIQKDASHLSTTQPVEQQIAEKVDFLSFLAAHTGLKTPPAEG